MMRCPKCVYTKLKKEEGKLICPDCGYVYPKKAPTTKEFIAYEGTLNFECKPNDGLFLTNKHGVASESLMLPRSWGEYIFKHFFNEEPFIGSKKVKRYIVEASYKIKAVT